MKRALILLLTLPLFAQQTTPPPAAPPREARIPQAVERTLENGLRVIVVPKPEIPLVASRLMIRAGAAADPNGKAGVAALTATVLTQGTKTRTAEEIARGVEALGATLNADAGWDATYVDVSVMSSRLSEALEYVADVARNATFASEEVERERAQTIDALQVELGEPRNVASLVASRLMFGSAPYGNNLAGAPATVKGLAREDLVRFHRQHYRPSNAVLVLAGDVKAEAAFALARKAFGTWRAAPGATAVAPRRSTPASGRVVVIDMPEAGQAAVAVARPGIRRADPAYFSAAVTNSVLGGGYSSRLNQEIRIRRGLSYGAGSAFDARVDVGPFTARTETKHESAAEVAALMTGELRRLGSEDVAETELTPRKAALIGAFAQSLETTAGIVSQVSSLALYGLPLTDVNRYIGGVQNVTANDVRRFASTKLGGDVNVVIVGDAKQFVEPLRRQFNDVEVISLADLDPASPTLLVRKAKQ